MSRISFEIVGLPPVGAGGDTRAVDEPATSGFAEKLSSVSGEDGNGSLDDSGTTEVAEPAPTVEKGDSNSDSDASEGEATTEEAAVEQKPVEPEEAASEESDSEEEAVVQAPVVLLAEAPKGAEIETPIAVETVEGESKPPAGAASEDAESPEPLPGQSGESNQQEEASVESAEAAVDEFATGEGESESARTESSDGVADALSKPIRQAAEGDTSDTSGPTPPTPTPGPASTAEETITAPPTPAQQDTGGDAEQQSDQQQGRQERSAAVAPTQAAASAEPADTAVEIEKPSEAIEATSAPSAAEPKDSPRPDAATPLARVAAGKITAARAEQSEGADQAPRVDASRFVGRVSRAFQAAQERGGEVRLRLSPPELGSLQIKLTVSEGALTASVEAETTSARNLLLDNLPALRERLAEQEIRVEKFDVDVRQEGGGNQEDWAPRERRDGSRSRDAAVLSEDGEPKDSEAVEQANSGPQATAGGDSINLVA